MPSFDIMTRTLKDRLYLLFHRFLVSLYDASNFWSGLENFLRNRICGPGAQSSHDDGEFTADNDSIIRPYKPKGVDEILFCGTSATIYRTSTGVILKSPAEPWWDTDRLSLTRKERFNRLKNSFHVETEILKTLGKHPRLIRYLGRSDDPEAYGILFGQASHGNLQQYLDSLAHHTSQHLQLNWCIQIAEAISYIHANGVVHSDLRPENILLDADTNGELGIRLCDFGGSTFGELDGGSLPDSGFADPRAPWTSVPATDIFALGSMIYTIMTGHWPYGSMGSRHLLDFQEKRKYEELVDLRFGSATWPSLEDLDCADIILACWTGGASTANSVLEALETLKRNRQGNSGA